MEITIQWFWIIKLLFLAIGLSLAWKYYRTRKNIYGILIIIWVILAVINPVKLEVNTREINRVSNDKIERSKVLPDKIEDRSYEDRKKISGITKEDLE